MTRTKLASLLSVFATLIVCAVAAVGAPAPAPHDLPAGFTVSSNFREDVRRRQYWDFDTVTYQYIPANAKNSTREKVEGHLWRTAVAAVVPNNNGDAVAALMAADFEKDGWTVLRRQGVVVAHKTGGGHDLWVNGTGNSGDFRLELMEVSPPGRSLNLKPPQAQVETVSDDQDLPYLLPLPGSKMEKTVYDHRSFEILLPNAKQPTLAFPAMTRWYDEPPGVSSYELATVYRKALEVAGWDITRAQIGGDVALTAHYGKNGRDIWLYTHGDGGKQNVNIVDFGAETKESTLKQQLAKDGHVALYGIYFDTDSSVPRPESEATLQNVLQMLKADTTLKLEVQGHTDNTGAPDHNAMLSDARAASIKQWLTSRGIATNSLTSKGYGASKPVADNNSQEGKAKNRRVELVKIAALSPAGTAVAANAPAAPSAPASASAANAKGPQLVCTLAAAKGNDHPVSIKNSTGKVLKKETIINYVLNWKSPATPGEQDSCFAIDSDLAANAGLTRTVTLDNGAVGQTCSAYISNEHPIVVHANDGGLFTQCDPP